ncbi:MAG TPA: hypothetical protein VHN11_11980 [Xanthobacteraceae bacterium]|jgi:hypothetical protein|nr:hypothetical protein [Xanthobacteraceae bacterium]
MSKRNDIQKGAAESNQDVSPVAAPAAANAETSTRSLVAKLGAHKRFITIAATVAIVGGVGAFAEDFDLASVQRSAASVQQTVMQYIPSLPSLPSWNSKPALVVEVEPTDEVTKLKDTVAQLRGNVKTLNENLSSMRLSLNSSNMATSTQFAKINETLERVERTQTARLQAARHAAVAAAPAPQTAPAPQAVAFQTDITGSIYGQQPQTPAQPGLTSADLKKRPVAMGWVLRNVYNGVAQVEGKPGMLTVRVGEVLPRLGRVQQIVQLDGHWVVATQRAIITMP